MIEGTAEADNLVGSDGDDIIIGGGGEDTMTGGGGSDIFRYEGPWWEERTDTITDFAPAQDAINLFALFDTNDHNSSTPFADYIRLTEDNGGVIVEGNFKGDSKPDFFRTFVKLEGVSITDLSPANFILTEGGEPPEPQPITVAIAPTEDALEPITDGEFTVSLSQAAADDVEVFYTVSGDATPDGDYTALSGSVTIPQGATDASIPVDVIDDNLDEGEETISLT